ncbi:unnamed protein product [Rhizophagus irregularis]|nr:unnamed protein product [Rhizophagus irregularis]
MVQLVQKQAKKKGGEFQLRIKRIYGVYFNKLDPPKPKHKKGSCNVEIITNKGVKVCGHIINTDGSTGNFWYHLEAHHGILRSEKENNNNPVQSKIDAAFKKQWAKNPKRKQECDEALAEFLVDDMQPLYTLKSEGFINLVKTLDPYYTLPSDKYIKQLITKSYNYSKQELLTLFKDTIKFCSITTDLWTARDRQGYIGGEKYATASFIYYVVTTFQVKVIPEEIETVDLTNDDDAFDDVEFEDGNDNDVVIMNESQNKKRKIKIKDPLKCEEKFEEVKRNLYHLLLHYWENPAREGMVSALLDPRVKSLNFVSNLKKEETISHLRNEYQSVKESEEFISNTRISNDNDFDILESNNSLFIDMFAESQNAENEINEYLSLPQLPLKTDPFKCVIGNIFPPEIYNEINEI